jgi:vitamin K-dependent gamma-carboxylase-like protein
MPSALWDWYCPPTPVARLRLLRFVIGAYALVYLISRGVHLNAVVSYPAAAFRPVGIVRVLTEPLLPGAVYGTYAAAVLAAGLFTAGVAYRVAAPIFSLLLLWVTSYRHSFGMIFHTDNLLVLHVPLLAFASAGRAPRAAAPSLEPDMVRSWVPRAMCLVTVAAYVVAGVAKLTHTGWSWAGGEPLREQIAYDALRKIELGSTYSPLGPWLLGQAWLFAPLSAFSLATELLAPLALLGVRAAVVWCACAWLFHAGVLALMAIAFPYPLSGCAFAAFFPLERFLQALERRLRRGSSREAPPVRAAPPART